MFAIGSMLFVGASAKCEMQDIMTLIMGGDDGDDRRRRLVDGMGGMFDGVPEDCIPCVSDCIAEAFASGMTSEDQGAEYYMCFFNCGETDYDAPCSVGDMMSIQQTSESMFSDLGNVGGGDPGADLGNIGDLFQNPFESVEGLDKQCVDCQTKCLDETLVPALEAIGSALENALNGGSGNPGDGLDFEGSMAKFGFCSTCCVGLDMSASLMPGSSCQAEFKNTIPQMFGSSSGGSSGSDNTGMIVGIVVAVVVVLLIAAGVGFYCYKKEPVPEPEGPSTPMNTTGEGEEPSIANV